MTIYVEGRVGKNHHCPVDRASGHRENWRCRQSHARQRASRQHSKSNSEATKSCSGYPVDLVPDSRGCLSLVSVSALIVTKKTDGGPVIDECVSLNEFLGWPERDEDLERGYLLVAVMAV